MKEIETKITISFDRQADAYYYYLAEIGKNEVAQSIPVEDVVNGEIVLDFNKDNQLIGIEIIGSGLMPQSVKNITE